MMHLSSVVEPWAGLSAAAQPVTESLFAAVWQGALLSMLACAGLRLLPKTPAAVRFAIWFGVFVVVAALPLAGLLSHKASAGPTGMYHAWFTLDARWSMAIAAVWFLASMMRAGTLVLAAIRIRSLWQRAVPVEVSEATAAWRRQAQVCVSDEVDRPSVIGFFAPKILIPRWLLEKLTVGELQQIVLHEAGHLGRADDWLNLLQKLALVVFPLNPALAWVERRLCFERELACDERVLEETGAPKAYAACLAALAEYRLGRRGTSLSLALGIGGVRGRQSELGQRVGRILAGGGSMRPLHARLVMSVAMLGLMLGSVELARCPQVVGFAESKGQESGTMLANVVVPASRRFSGMGGYGAQAVMFHTSTAAHNDGMPQLLKPHLGGEVYGTAKAVSLSKGTSVRKVVAAKFAVVQSLPADEARTVRVERYLLISEWSGGYGARVVMTTASVPAADRGAAPAMRSDGAEPISSAGAYDGADFLDDATGDEQTEREPSQVHPYAAVPVRGGWLVIQL